MRWLHTRMSLRSLADSGGIDGGALAVGDQEKVRVGGVGGADEVHGAAEQGFEVFLEAEETVGEAVGSRAGEFIEKVYVAGGGVEVIAGGGAEDFQAAQAVLAA